MIAILNGEEGGSIYLYKGGSDLLRLQLLSDGAVGPTGQVSAIGSPLDVTGDTITVEFYDAPDRRNAATKSVPATIVAATNGYTTVTVAAATIDFGPGTFYAFVKRSENTGSTIEFSRKYNVVTVR